jgi:hypothetical protein
MSVDPHVQTLADGLHAALLPAVEECDQSMHGVAISQQVLHNQLDKLSAELSKFTDPIQVQALIGYTAKLQRIRRTVTGTNEVLDKVHARLERVRLQFGV